MTHQQENPLGDSSCYEYAELSRRQFLGQTSRFLTLGASTTAWLPRIALGKPAAAGPPRDTFISIFLSGGQDGLTAVPPYGDPDYASQRPTLAVPPPGEPNGALDLDGFFGLAPAAAPLMTPYSRGHLLVVHATGSPDPNLSHFTSQMRMELGTPNMPASPITSGWLARHLSTTPALGAGDLRGVAFSSTLPATLFGAPGALPVADPADIGFPGNPATGAERRAVLSSMYSRAQEPLGSAAASTLETIDVLQAIDFANYVPENGAVYPASPFGQSLRAMAAMIKADIDLEAAHVSLGGWDHHAMQGPVNGIMAQLLDEFSRTIEAFYIDMSNHLDRFTLAAMTEFGRRIAENGSLGTDHGHGGVIWILGGQVDGGRVLADWPGLLGGNGSLSVTIDYRDLLAEILAERMQSNDLASVFPGYQPSFRNIIV